MGNDRGPAGAHAIAFYGLPVRTRSLVLVAFAQQFLGMGALPFLRGMRLVCPRPSSDKPILRLPPELWDRLEADLRDELWRLAPETGFFHMICDDEECQDTPSSEVWPLVTLDKFVRSTFKPLPDSQYDGRCLVCGGGDWEGGRRWDELLEDGLIREVVNNLLAPYGLALPTSEQYDHPDTANDERRTGCFVALPSRIVKKSRYDNRLIASDRVSTSTWGYDEPGETSRHALLDVLQPIPAGADERFEKLLRDWPQLEALESDAEVRLTGVQEEERKDKEGKPTVKPGWRVFLKAEMHGWY
ncbi:hypothetical protein JCM8097_006780 [Rhodosporidiobolus ruineniae]